MKHPLSPCLAPTGTTSHPLDREWAFRRLGGPAGPEAWTLVDLPHSPFIADLDGRDHWFGECEYRRTLPPLALPPGASCALFVGAAMHTARVFLAGRELARHEGGYLPFEVDLTPALPPHGGELLLRLDNRDHPRVPPGKPYAELDFCWYGGLYRDVALRLRPAVHLTDPVAAGEVAGGGVFIRTLAADAATATLHVRAHVRNTSPLAQALRAHVAFEHAGATVATGVTATVVLPPGGARHLEQEVVLPRPRLWSPDAPHLHTARVTLLAPDGATLDTHTTRHGVRRIGFSRSDGFTINGRRLRLRGTNRHQELPRVGSAAPAAAQRRDARLIKEAGFDYVRLSHYPQSPAFLDACDELGLVVMNSIPGWQFLGDEAFRAACVQNARDLIRRDRHHACVVLWELSLNETEMDAPFMARLHAAGHEEYPGDQCFTCGWRDHYDVFIHARQHGALHHWRNADKALVVSEYGDWEFFAANEGFDQRTGAGIFDPWSHGRHLRAAGERGLRQQVDNHLLALNDTLASPAALDGQWSMFDYARGYAAERAACGIMDVFRLPKFSWWFYRSQRDPAATGAGWTGGPVVFIASHWTPASHLRVLVFTNCDTVELRLNGASLGRHRPARAWLTQHLPHPPCVFELPAFTPGVLDATGFLADHPAATHRVATPGAPARLELTVADAGIFAQPGEPDVLLAHARVLDAAGQLCVADAARVTFAVNGPVTIVGPADPAAEAGIASLVLRLPAAAPGFTLHATRLGAAGALTATLTWSAPHALPAAGSPSPLAPAEPALAAAGHPA